MKKIKMDFINLPQELCFGVEEMRKHMNFAEGGVQIAVEKSDKLEIGYKDGIGYIHYIEKHHFFRLMVLFAQYFEGKEFHMEETAHFEVLSIMLDLAAGAANTVDSLKEYMRYMASMGYNQLQMYLEDMFEVPERPHFGYLKGRYTKAELKEIDDYGYELGIEVVPNIQTLGHMANYLRWGSECGDIKENDTVLLPESEKTYAFIEQMIKNISECFRTKRIHVGLDETHGLGMGTYFKKNGYKNPLNIFVEHVAKVTEIALKYGLKPMMWGDMFFCLSCESYGQYERETELSPEVLAGIPKEMQLVYWHYGELLDADDYMIDKYQKIGNPLMYAGGVWLWTGMLPDNIFSSLGSEIALKTCKEKGVKEVMLTVWSYAGVAPYITSLLEMQRYAEHAYNDNSDRLKERFEFVTGASYESFIRMSDFYAMYLEGDIDYDSMHYNARFSGKMFMWQDIMLGVADHEVYKAPWDAHYANVRDLYKPYIDRADKWQDLYDFCYSLMDFMSTKCYIAKRLAPAYKEGNHALLREIAKVQLPLLIEKTEKLSLARTMLWEQSAKPFGMEEPDMMLGTVAQRCKSAKRRLERYLNGEVACLEELEEERLPFPANAWFPSHRRLAVIRSL